MPIYEYLCPDCRERFEKLVLQTKEGAMEEVDARPSDSIALALRAEAPIFVAEDVLNQVASSYGL